MIRFFYLLCIATIFSSLECSIVPFGPHRLSGFVETGYFKRSREGGSHQSGHVWGIGAEYESLRDCGLYLFAKAETTKGTLKGSTGDDSLKSNINGEDYYGRFGWSIGLHKLIIAPYVGAGYTRIFNDFIEPSPLIVSMKTHFPYALAGVKIEWQKSDELQFFSSFQLKKPYEPQCIIDDPEFFVIHQTIKKELQADFELGVRYNLICFPLPLGIQGAFFYQYNHFGRHENFPFNFMDTTHRYLGLRVALTAVF